MGEARPPRNALAEMLTVETEGRGAASARLEGFWGTAVAGDLLARAVLAVGSEAAGPLRAIHASFLRPVSPDRRLVLASEALAPGRMRLVVHEGNVVCAELWLRFGPEGGGLDYQSSAPEGGLPAPEVLPSEAETAAREGWSAYAVGPIEARRVSAYVPVKPHEPAVWLGWLAPRVPLGGSPLLHAAALAFLSEYRSHWAVELRLGADFPKTDLSLLDHALWVHHAVPWDDWWLVRTESEVGVAGRCFSRRSVFTREGVLVASAAWEAVARRR